ncbi:MAG: hypothetical protein LBB24_02365 [Rickettsiales bacterium]|jgi:hypothetical protein|nr:hypothetical protein [Rickettsiales bacterium]
MDDLDEIREKVRKLLEDDGSSSGGVEKSRESRGKAKTGKNLDNLKKGDEGKKGFFSRLFGKKK